MLGFVIGNAPRFLGHEVIPARLAKLISDSVNKKILFITGPAGMGKTTILTEYAKQAEQKENAKVIWLSPANSDCSDSLSLEDAILPLLKNQDNDHRISKRVFVILDNIEKRNSVENGYSDLFKNNSFLTTPNISFAIASDYKLEIPLSRLRLAGQVTELEMPDLIYTASEAERLLSGLYPSVSKEDLAMLYNISLGWPIAVRMMRIMLETGCSAKETAQSFSAYNSWSADFIREEIMPSLSGEARRLLLYLSLYTTFPVASLQQVFGINSLNTTLEELGETNLIIRSFDKDGTEYIKLHPFVRGAIKQICRISADKKVSLAAFRDGLNLLNARGDYKIALQSALEYGDYRCVFSVLSDNLTRALFETSRQDLANLLRNVPYPEGESGFYYALIEAWLAVMDGNPKRAALWLKKADSVNDVVDCYKNGGIVSIRESILLGIDLFSRQYDNAICRGKQLINNLGGKQLFLRMIVANRLSEAYQRIGQYEKAAECSMGAYELAKSCGGGVIAPLSASNLAWCMFVSGKLSEASNVIMRAIRDLKECEGGKSWSFAVLYISLARIYIQWGDFKKARLYLEKADCYLDVSKNLDMLLEYKVSKARCLAHEDRIEEAREQLVGAMELLDSESEARGANALVMISYADFLTNRGSLVNAEEVLLKLSSRVDSRDAFYNIHIDLISAKIALTRGQYNEAEQKLRLAYKCCVDSQANLLLTDIQYNLVEVLLAKGERAEAQELLVKTLNEAHDEERVYCFHEATSQGMELIRDVAFSQNNNRIASKELAVAKEHASLILKTFYAWSDSYEMPGDTNQEVVAVFSDREKEIYELLKSGKTRKEISESLGIKVNTVRTHAKNIYRKLGIHDSAML